MAIKKNLRWIETINKSTKMPQVEKEGNQESSTAPATPMSNSSVNGNSVFTPSIHAILQNNSVGFSPALTYGFIIPWFKSADC